MNEKNNNQSKGEVTQHRSSEDPDIESFNLALLLQELSGTPVWQPKHENNLVTAEDLPF